MQYQSILVTKLLARHGGILVRGYPGLNSPDAAASVIVPYDYRANTISGFLTHPSPFAHLTELLQFPGAHARPLQPHDVVHLLKDGLFQAPIEQQEVWAAGCTYLRSKTARERESVGAAVFYDGVYNADRPEIFFKATAGRVVGHGGQVCIRPDSNWNVPEPEFTIVPFVDPLTGKLRPLDQGCAITIGNDMSSRRIEGDNPLYLPQAKSYTGACAMGPSLMILPGAPPTTLKLSMRILRGGAEVFTGETTLGAMKRGLQALVDWLQKAMTFSMGVMYLTGTGIIPPDDFTLAVGDVIHMQMDGVGTLTNTVALAA